MIKELFLLFGSLLLILIGLIVFPFQVIFRLFSKDYDLPYYLHQLSVSNDSLAGSLIYGSRHTISAITGYKAFLNNKWHLRQEWIIDFFFGQGHCNKNAWEEGLINDELVKKRLEE